MCVKFFFFTSAKKSKETNKKLKHTMCVPGGAAMLQDATREDGPYQGQAPWRWLAHPLSQGSRC